MAFILFLMENPVSIQCKGLWTNSADPDQMPHFVVSGLDLHCLPMSLYRLRDKNRLRCAACMRFYIPVYLFAPVETLSRLLIIIHLIWVFDVCSDVMCDYLE